MALSEGFTREYYISTRIFHQEKEIFHRNWTFVCHKSSLPNVGDCRMLNLAGVSAIVINDGKNISAYSNICLHRGTPLITQAMGNLQMIECPYHGWKYAIDGCLLQGQKTASSFSLQRFAVKDLGGYLFVNITREAESPKLEIDFEAFFRKYNLREVYQVADRNYSIKANWKLLIENFEECYHCQSIHPLLSASSAHAVAESSDSQEEEIAYEKYCNTWNEANDIGPQYFSAVDAETDHWFGRYPLTEHFYTQTKDGTPTTGLLGNLTKFDRGISSFRLYPTFYLICNSDYAVSFHFIPKTPGETDLRISWYIHKRNTLTTAQLEKLTAFWDITIAEDNAICERQFEGVTDELFTKMTYLPAEEYSYNFDRWYLNQLKLANHAPNHQDPLGHRSLGNPGSLP